MLQSAYLGVQKYFRHGQWYHETDMRTGQATYWQLTSLQAFWPSLQVLVGDIAAANSSHREFFSVWERFGVLPERYHPSCSYEVISSSLIDIGILDESNNNTTTLLHCYQLWIKPRQIGESRLELCQRSSTLVQLHKLFP
ncbi:alpha-mannosidase I MNS5-like [Camellia sinensis]|uniref:alpha-mannosidase I MNS5-like n=1 Tax=Camellia sinensis TaxID=4442 RepID=UPI00103647C2|nr:alpha-mannosidase I MNS5-like [Camellia sinensis]